jgi:hypothetical protein
MMLSERKSEEQSLHARKRQSPRLSQKRREVAI